MSKLITGKTGVVGIFGYPVEHSFSPPMHNAAFDQLNLDMCYIPLPTNPADLKNAVQGFRAMGFKGANVTIPHKTEIGQYLDALDPIAELTGSVNTLYYQDGQLRGTSTDPFGALENLRRSGVDLAGKQIAILGYGGAARAIAFEICLQYPDQTLIIQGRNREKAQSLVDELNAKVPRVLLKNTETLNSDSPSQSDTAASLTNHKAASSTHHFDPNQPRAIYIQDYLEMSKQTEIIINCTPLGMHPNEDSSPCGPDDFDSKQVIYDIVYAPRETKWMKEAKAHGCQVIGGLGMLVYQGFKSFELWTGQEPSAELMFDALKHL